MSFSVLSKTNNRRFAKLGALFAAFALLAAGCSSEAADLSPNNTEIAGVIDVRTPAEFASGHVQNSVNMDVQGADFAAQIATLDPALTYLVYCRSGNRSAVAVDQMEAAGLTVLDGGGLQDMADRGWVFVS